MLIESLKVLLSNSWSKETCMPGLKDKWDELNPSIGQSDVSSLMFSIFFGAKIMRCTSLKGVHYYNKMPTFTYDLAPEDIGECIYSEEVDRSELLKNDETKERLNILLKNMKSYIETNMKYDEEAIELMELINLRELKEEVKRDKELMRRLTMEEEY